MGACERDMKNVLFVCTANLQRSPTAEKMFQGWDDLWEARSAGIMPDQDGRPLTQELVDWADIIIVMEHLQALYIRARFRRTAGKIHVLGIADRYSRDDPELRHVLQKKVPPILKKY